MGRSTAERGQLGVTGAQGGVHRLVVGRLDRDQQVGGARRRGRAETHAREQVEVERGAHGDQRGAHPGDQTHRLADLHEADGVVIAAVTDLDDARHSGFLLV